MSYVNFNCPHCSSPSQIRRSSCDLGAETTCSCCGQNFLLLAKYIDPADSHLISGLRQNLYKPSSLFSIEGRVSRTQYLIGSIICSISTVVGLLLAGLLTLAIPPESLLILLPISILSTTLIVCTCSSIVLTVRRMHDFNRSGWWVIGILVPVIGVFFLWKLVLAPGTQKPNQYGQPPT